jgi:dihydroorotase/N-acyl-D-amino-acid deacylase
MSKRFVRSRFISLAAFALLASAAAVAEDYDLIFAGGRVVDGTGAPWFRADVGVKGDRIAAVRDLSQASAARRIDAKSLVVAPGFIDMMGQSEYHVLVDGRAASKITQGITTEVTGEGGSIAPLNTRLNKDASDVYQHYGVTPGFTDFTGYFAEFARRGSAINLATFVGAGQVRNLVIGKEDRAATPQELKAMEAEVAKAMEQGAMGLSTSLIYVPDHFASTEEIIALATVAARYGGTYTSHQRDEGDDNAGGIDASMDEFLRIVREAKLPGEIYHIKAASRANWGRMPSMLKKLADARAQGLDVVADQYPWTASSNGLADSLPLWVREGGADKMGARLKNKSTRKKIRADYLKLDPEWPESASRILITSVLNPDLRKYQGKTLADIAKEENKDPLDVMMDIVAADHGNTSRVTFSMSEDDVRVALRDPFVSFNTDSPAMAEDGIFSEEKSHPRAWGSATRILGYYVRDEKVLSLEEAIRKMTSLPASRMRFADRGIVRPGMAADLVVFDPATVRERATFADPNHYSEGVPYVAVNGKLVVDGGKITEARPGIILKGPGYKAAQ